MEARHTSGQATTHLQAAQALADALELVEARSDLGVMLAERNRYIERASELRAEAAGQETFRQREHGYNAAALKIAAAQGLQRQINITRVRIAQLEGRDVSARPVLVTAEQCSDVDETAGIV